MNDICCCGMEYATARGHNDLPSNSPENTPLLMVEIKKKIRFLNFPPKVFFLKKKKTTGVYVLQDVITNS